MKNYGIVPKLQQLLQFNPALVSIWCVLEGLTRMSIWHVMVRLMMCSYP
ncbi:hypothetical protein V6Z11_A04G141200 [Gossypium hirsutum]